MGIDWSRAFIRGTGPTANMAFVLVIGLIPLAIVWTTLAEVPWLLSWGDIVAFDNGEWPAWYWLVICPIITAVAAATAVTVVRAALAKRQAANRAATPCWHDSPHPASTWSPSTPTATARSAPGTCSPTRPNRSSSPTPA